MGWPAGRKQAADGADSGKTPLGHPCGVCVGAAVLCMLLMAVYVCTSAAPLRASHVQVNEAMQRVAEGKARYRIVLTSDWKD